MTQNVPVIPKFIGLTIAGLETVSLAFTNPSGILGTWKTSHVPMSAINVELQTVPTGTMPGAPVVTVVTVKPKEFLNHKIMFQLIHTDNPTETINVTVEMLLLGKE